MNTELLVPPHSSMGSLKADLFISILLLILGLLPFFGG